MKSSPMVVYFIILWLGAAGGCERAPANGGGEGAGASSASAPATGPVRADPRAEARGKRVRVVFLGDSLTAGLGVEADQAFPALVGTALESEGLGVEVVNAGVSGDTTAGGLRRTAWLLKQKPDVVIVGLGGNDGLRGIDPKSSEENLRGIIAQARGAGAEVLLLGMLIPPNYGPEYAGQFRAVYPRLAAELKVPLVPFVLEGVGGRAELNQPDGIHPTAEGHRVIARNVSGALGELVRARGSRSTGG